MDRRNAIKRTAILMGGAISTPALTGILQGCSPARKPDWVPQFLTEDEALMIGDIAEIIIPETETPGAKTAGVPEFIDLMLKDVYEPEDQEKFKSGMQQFDQRAQEEYGSSFVKMDGEERTEFVTKVHQEALENASDPGSRPFIMMVKELTFLGFFTSEPGATQVLQYEAVPGDYNGCEPLEEIGKTWAT